MFEVGGLRQGMEVASEMYAYVVYYYHDSQFGEAKVPAVMLKR